LDGLDLCFRRTAPYTSCTEGAPDAKTEKSAHTLHPLLEEHIKIANLIRHLDKELTAMLADPDPTGFHRDFDQPRWTTIFALLTSKEIVRHCEELETQHRKKLKGMTFQ
jgi:hypothetical protein